MRGFTVLSKVFLKSGILDGVIKQCMVANLGLGSKMFRPPCTHNPNFRLQKFLNFPFLAPNPYFVYSCGAVLIQIVVSTMNLFLENTFGPGREFSGQLIPITSFWAQKFLRDYIFVQKCILHLCGA